MKFLIFAFISFSLWAEEPSLPAGLGGEKKDEPTFEFDSNPKTSETDKEETSGRDEEAPLFDYFGFLDLRAGTRINTDPSQHDLSLADIRLHNEISKDYESSKLIFSGDFLGDFERSDSDDTNLRDGTGLFDLRELNFSTTPVSSIDIKIGRQILTWGTGDMIFINDLFPKDWQSFFMGRDLTYLKAPSDAVKASIYTDLVNINLVYTPFFNSDRHIDGSKISYYSPLLGKKVGRDTPFVKEENEKGEWALRLEKKISSTEFALYGYKGYWKSPSGVNAQGKYYHPELNVYGASVRSPLLGGVGNAEFGYYESSEDKKGNNPFVPNDELRFLVGYEHELVKNTTGSMQYYVEHMLDYDEYLSTLMGVKKDESRHMATLKVRKEMLKQTLSFTAMLFYSPTDSDGHGRLSLDYKLTDDVKLFAGSNLFFGKEKTTFWGQFEDNSNIFAGTTINF
ncbi:MAG: hypothetical protein H6621_09625 [Halobacteriovoraceae bacterium]|nr:hypothetical protein [Halobacteriovoraceae bacterium]MCB9095316.1 hypothetical protein [Halobacteriovoraceae bacterium]